MGKNWVKLIFLFLVIVFIYNINGREIGSGDTIPATYLPISIIKEGNFDLDEFPFLYEKDGSYYKRYKNYYLKYRRNHYLSAYPPGGALVALPVYIIPVLRGISPQSKDILDLAKLSATLIAALSAIFLYLALKRLLKEKGALFITLIYALGTNTWSVSSQALWQHGPSQLFLTLTVYFLIRGLKEKKYIGICGFSLAFAILCRPTNILIALPLIVYVLHKYRGKFLEFFFWSLPPTIFLLIYNYFYFGSFFQMGYGGRASFWTTAFGEGLLGILFSPSRGLLVYSPVLIFSFVGMVLVWKRRDKDKTSANTFLRYLSFGPILIVLLYSKWFMWWGGHSFGPRLLVDLTPILALFLYPVYEKITSKLFLKIIFIILLAFSINAQVIGAFFYNGSWNTNPNVDGHKERLWQWKDSQLLHYLFPEFSKPNPKINEERSGEYLVGAHYYVWYPKNWQQGYLRGVLNPTQVPLLGEYSSSDFKVIEQHISWSKKYGIDFWTLDWWPERPERDKIIKDYICKAKNIGDIKFCIFYESWGRGFDKNLCATVFNEETTRAFLADFKYIAKTYFSHPSYLKIDNRPVVILYATRSFIGSYKEAISLLRKRIKELGYEIYLIGDEVFWSVRKENPLTVTQMPNIERIKLFNAITAYNMYEGSKHKQGGYANNSTFFKDVSAKYREYKKAAEENNVDFIPGIMPGYNDRGVRLGVNHYVIPRQISPEVEGSFFEESWERLAFPFLDPSINMVLITSWNEWNEGTQIEPTVLSPPTNTDISESGKDYTQGYFYSGYGEKYLEIIKNKLK